MYSNSNRNDHLNSCDEHCAIFVCLRRTGMPSYTHTYIILLPVFVSRFAKNRNAAATTVQLFTRSVVRKHRAHTSIYKRAMLVPYTGFCTKDSHDRRSTRDPPPPRAPVDRITTATRGTATGERRA
uniref:Uncharacterized protein n=1 Tax=Sipha flava TaxID=143950 RepID=A0A2S2Q500_9HEMI